MPTVITTLPEQGQIVSVRQRRFVVTAVQKSTLPPQVLSRQPLAPQHLVTLNAIEDAALGALGARRADAARQFVARNDLERMQQKKCQWVMAVS